MLDVPAISLDRTRKRYGERVVMHETSLEVARGRAVAIVGPSGGGKSTVLRMVMGLVAPDAGTVKVFGDAMTPASALGLRRKMGYVIQEGGLFPHLTARRNVTLMAEHVGWEEERTGARVEELRALVALPADALDRHPIELSGGQRQRVGIMRALFLDPEIVLMDEPLGALDPLVRARLRKDLVGIFERLGKTVLLVTHDMEEAELLADELVIVDGGRIVQRGDADALRASPATSLVAELVARGGAA
jgi:osmoprotectant transport system ATP-binding protein